MGLLDKPLREITESDIRARIREPVEEQQTLDYKGKAYGSSDSEKRELLKDVTAMANTGGGDLVIGIREEEGMAGMPGSLDGIANGDVESQRILQICSDGIEERIEGLEVRAIHLDSGRDIVIVRIPRSSRAPHMVAHAGFRQFWARHGTITAPMRVTDLRDAFRREPDVRWQLEEFLQTQKRFRVNPILPIQNQKDEWQVDRLEPGHVVLQKLSGGQDVLVPLTWVREVRRDSLDRYIVLELADARMQWTHPSQRWQCLQPRTDTMSPIGFGKDVGGTDVKFVPITAQLNAMGYVLAWSYEHKAGLLASQGNEVIYDDDGFFFSVSEKAGRVVLFGKSSRRAGEPR